MQGYTLQYFLVLVIMTSKDWLLKLFLNAIFSQSVKFSVLCNKGQVQRLTDVTPAG